MWARRRQRRCLLFSSHVQTKWSAVNIRAARRILQIGALLVMLAVVSGPLFDLDRFQVPKELLLHLAAFGALVMVLRSARSLSFGLVDCLLVGFALVSSIAAVAAPNGWLAFRAMGITWAGLACFWSGRAIADAGLARPLLAVLAAVTVLGSGIALLQAYDVPMPLMAAARLPGGSYGNRNFMAHAAAIGLPLVLYLTLSSATRWGVIAGAAGAAVSSAALLLSRTRAAWVAVAVGLLFLLIEGIWISGLWRERATRSRLAALVGAGALGLAAAFLLPNALEWKSDTPYLDSLVGVANFRDGSGHGRLVQWRNTLRMAEDHPILGVGPGNWQVYYPLYTTPGDPAYDHGDPIPTNPWPSSDWMAFLSERGVLATALLAAAVGGLMFVGWRRSRRHGAEQEGLAGLAMVAVLLVAVVAGAFDAVMLLAVPTLIVWTAAGALRPPPRRLVTLPGGAAQGMMWGAAGLGTLFAARSALTALAILVAGSGSSRSQLVWASRLDPGEYRLHMLLARKPGVGGACAAVREHATDARELFPYHEAPKRALRVCGVR
jgi:O-antigen ligase